jgi:hypothetical protein
MALVTVTLVNRTAVSDAVETGALFQCQFKADCYRDQALVAAIHPYPGPEFTKLDPEEQSLRLLYRGFRTFAIGHGCAANWELPLGSATTTVRGDPLPLAEVASVTPDIVDGDGAPIRVSMAALAGLVPEDDGSAAIERLLHSYETWLEDRAREIPLLESDLQKVASRHVMQGRQALDRMRRGVALLGSDPVIHRAFSLANRAVLLQQLHGERESRQILGQASGGYRFSRSMTAVDPSLPSGDRGYWRAFQIAFLLMTLESTTDPGAADREVVELIWFPTGGGKTEAYLGLAAYSIFLRRLRSGDDRGVEVLMRYTLRLLTTQQFQRAATLICAMELIRREAESDLGSVPFSIGIWLGSATTPNTRAAALAALRNLQVRPNAANPFLLTQCPWCAAQIGPLPRGPHGGGARVAGYSQRGGTVAISCPDSGCPFSSRLPVLVIDEDIYASPPDLLIGTVDKFAQLAWQPATRSLFGIGIDGQRAWSPPGLIIQDELHLISGPLGSLVGLYELAVNELCTDRRPGRGRVPKIVTSTATVRNHEEQLRALYGRERAHLFPPPALDIRDSFFARHATLADGAPAPGRWYVGIHATNHRSLITTQVQAMAALLQGPASWPRERADPWWTLMVFFNNLRELGTSLSLLQSNVPMHLKAIANRRGLPSTEIRRIWNTLELTSRIQNDSVPRVMAALEVGAGSRSPKAVDVCLASNIIEVGIDIDRLSLMLVVGQPKTTAQYIQVTGRVGRRWRDRPGLILTLLNPARPRDRSHFEQFKSYHDRLYAQVEPTSVTPFSPPAVERALHAVMAAILRLSGGQDASERPVDVRPDDLRRLGELVGERARIVDNQEVERVMQIFARRSTELSMWARTRWGQPFSSDTESAQLTAADSAVGDLTTRFSWPTPLSLRNVDANCELEVTSSYLMDGQQRS